MDHYDEISISQQTTEVIPYDLLLLADPSLDMIDQYLSNSNIFFAKRREKIVGVIVLKQTNDHLEIMNVSVKESSQGIGIGTKLIQYAIQFAKSNQIIKLKIGTADTSLSQLKLYQKLGFKIIGRNKSFFIENYSEPIYESGKQAKDMIRLEMSLT